MCWKNDGEFDLVLLDLALPGIDGFAGLDILRRRFPAMPVAVVSAFNEPLPTITRVLNLGASGFIPRHFPAGPAVGRAPPGAGRQHLPPEQPVGRCHARCRNAHPACQERRAAG